MGKFQILAVFSDFWNRLGTIFSNPFQFIIFIFILSLLFTSLFLLKRNSNQIQIWIREFITKIFPSRHEVKLNEIICPNCRQGKGILNAVYVVHLDEQHVEGNCSFCGKFVRARIKN